MDEFCNATNVTRTHLDEESTTPSTDLYHTTHQIGHRYRHFLTTGSYFEDDFLSTARHGNLSPVVPVQRSPTEAEGSSSMADIEAMLESGMQTIGNATEYFVSYLGHNYSAFRKFFDLDILCPVVVAGLLLNVAAVFFLLREEMLLPRRAKRAILVCIALDEIFLLFIFCLTLLDSFYQGADFMERLNYFSCLFGWVQFVRSWTFHSVLFDTQKALETIRYSDGRSSNPIADESEDRFETDLKFRVKPMIPPLLFGTCYFILYLPPVRLLLNSLQAHSVCNVPVLNFWDLNDMSDPYGSEVFYLCLYLFPYMLAVYVVPLVMFSYRNKRIVDIVHRIQERRAFDLMMEEERVLHFAAFLSCQASLWIACESVKMTPLSLYAADLVRPFVRRAKYFLMYFNCLANFAIAMRSSSNLLTLPVLNANLKRLVNDYSGQLKSTFLKFSNNCKFRVRRCLHSKLVKMSDAEDGPGT